MSIYTYYVPTNTLEYIICTPTERKNVIHIKKKVENNNNFHSVAAKAMNTFSHYNVHSPRIDDNRKMANEYGYNCSQLSIHIVHCLSTACQ